MPRFLSFPRACPRCGVSGGPYYASQSLTASWCVACVRAASAQRHAAHRATILATARTRRLAALLALSPETWTRRQRAFVARQAGDVQAMPRCAYCWECKPLAVFRVVQAAPGPVRDSYCVGCRRLLNRLYHLAHPRRILRDGGREHGTGDG